MTPNAPTTRYTVTVTADPSRPISEVTIASALRHAVSRLGVDDVTVVEDPDPAEPPPPPQSIYDVLPRCIEATPEQIEQHIAEGRSIVIRSDGDNEIEVLRGVFVPLVVLPSRGEGQ